MATIVKPVEQKTKHLDYFLSQCHRRRYPAKSTIIYAGDKSDSLFYIVKGSVTVIIEDDDGREMIMAYLNAGDFFGEMGLFDNMDSRSAWVKAKTECEVAEISYTSFVKSPSKTQGFCTLSASRWLRACARPPVRWAIWPSLM